MRLALPHEIEDVAAFLLRHAASSMFPLSNLRQHGTKGSHPRTVRFWLAKDEGQITDVLTVSREGMVFPQCPRGDWAAAAKALGGLRIRGLIGEAAQVAALRSALGLAVPAGLDMHEPHYQLKLEDLIMPQLNDDKLVPLGDVPLGLAHAWRAEFCQEALNFPPQKAPQKAAEDVAAYLAADTHRVLLRAGQPAAMTGFNAVLPEIVQVGGVFTPPDARGQGLARCAVALHLAEARASGVKTAVLSAATEAAARAYEAIGFQKIGRFAILTWAEPQAAHG